MKNVKATYRFFGSIHVLRHKDGRKYPFELLRDFRFVRNGYQRFVVPVTSAAYKSATNWSAFASRIVGY